MAEPIRVLTNYGTDYGGTEILIMNLYRNMDRSKIQYDFYVHHDTKGKVAFEDEIIAMGGRVFREYYYNKEKNTTGYMSPYDFLKLHQEIKGVHWNVNFITTWYKLLAAARRLNLPIKIMHCHNSGYQYKLGIKDKVVEAYVKLRINGYANQCFACSEEAGRWMFGKKPFDVLKNGIVTERFRFDKKVREELRAMMKISETDMLIGTVSRLERQKNPMFLLELMRSLIWGGNKR